MNFGSVTVNGVNSNKQVFSVQNRMESILLLLLYSYTIREKTVQKFAGGVYEEKSSDWNTGL